MINIIISSKSKYYKKFLTDLNKTNKTSTFYFPENSRTYEEIKNWLKRFLLNYDKNKEYYILTRSAYLLGMVTLANKKFIVDKNIDHNKVDNNDLENLNKIYPSMISGDEIRLIEVSENDSKIIEHYDNMLSDDNILNNELNEINNVYRELLRFYSFFKG